MSRLIRALRGINITYEILAKEFMAKPADERRNRRTCLGHRLMAVSVDRGLGTWGIHSAVAVGHGIGRLGQSTRQRSES